MNAMRLEGLFMILVPLIIPILAFSYLFLAFSHEDYVNKKGQEYFHELYPDEYVPYDASYWCYLKIERERELKKKKKEDSEAKEK